MSGSGANNAPLGGGSNQAVAENGGAGNLSTKLSREERRKQKDEQAARQAGNMMPEVDVVSGRSINPHIPDWMAKPSWWQDTGSGPSLKHQKAPDKYAYDSSASKLEKAVKRHVVSGGATKYRKGACENCGSMSHKRKDCLERPRKKGAAWTNKNIAADESLEDGIDNNNWDEKRDRWAGYDPANHKHVVLEHEALEAARQKFREQQVDQSTDLKTVKKLAKAGSSSKKKDQEGEDEDDFGSSDESGDEDEVKYADNADAAGQKVDNKNRITVRNLRIREDTAKYLRNLDTESAYYDPKSRSMRQAPQATDNPEDASYAGDNFHRLSGQVRDLDKLQLFAWQAEARGQPVHLQTGPTQASLVHKQFEHKKDDLKETSGKSMLDKYGGAQHLQKPPKELLVGQNDNYVEYDRGTGQLVKGLERAKARSKYEEDNYPGNHTSVWGSWYKDGVWGFACCHSTMKQSYCVGELGKKPVQNDMGSTLAMKRKEAPTNGDGDGDAEEQPAKKPTTLKSGMHPTKQDQVPQEELEAYRLKRAEWEDPMKAADKDADGLIPL